MLCMKKHTVSIDENTAIILKTAVFDGNILRFDYILDRKDYLAVDKIVNLLGGKWKRNLKAHEFGKGIDAEKVVFEAINTGNVVDEKKSYQAFYTPKTVADKVAQAAAPAGKRVLEPNAGGGVLCEAVLRAGASEVVCVEIHPTAATELQAQGYKVYKQDFLTFFPDERFERIVMNPPFSSNQDIAHVSHAFDHCLAPGGVLVSVMRLAPERRKFRELLEKADRTAVFELDEKAFAESGTLVRTMIVTMEKTAVAPQIPDHQLSIAGPSKSEHRRTVELFQPSLF